MKMKIEAWRANVAGGGNKKEHRFSSALVKKCGVCHTLTDELLFGAGRGYASRELLQRSGESI